MRIKLVMIKRDGRMRGEYSSYSGGGGRKKSIHETEKEEEEDDDEDRQKSVVIIMMLMIRKKDSLPWSYNYQHGSCIQSLPIPHSTSSSSSFKGSYKHNNKRKKFRLYHPPCRKFWLSIPIHHHRHHYKLCCCFLQYGGRLQ